MPRTRTIPALFALLALTLCVPIYAANEPPWIEIHSAHFTVITDSTEKKGREVALRFEQMRATFAELLSKDRLHQAIPLTILALSNDKSYYQVAPLRQGQPIDVPGFLLPGDDQDFVVLNLSEEESWRAVAHDFAIRLLSYNYPPAQGWFDEGLAEYFSSIRVDNKQGELGGDPNLVASKQGASSAKSLVELLNTQEWRPLPDLFSGEIDATKTDSSAGQDIDHAESWIVMHYLLHEKKLAETGAYFNEVLNHHAPVEDAIQKAFGMSSAQLEQAVKDYFHARVAIFTATGAAGSGQTDRFPAPVGPEDSAIIPQPLPASDARALYAGIQVRIPERRDAGLKALHDLATAPTEADKKAQAKQQTQSKRVGEDAEQLPSNAMGSPLAHRILAWDHVQHGEFEEAFVEIGDAAALNQRDMWVRYYLAVAKYRMARVKHTEIVGLPNMMLDLKAVLEWNPEMADAYDLLAVARNSGGGATAAMQAERAAINLSPRNQRYALHLAEIYISSKKWEAADALLERLKASGDPQIVTSASELQAQSGAQRKYGIAASSGAASQQPKLEAQKSPFDVLEEDAAKRAATEGTGSGAADKRATKFVKGNLVSVDCSKAPVAVLTVKSDSGVLTLRTADYRSILLIGADDFSCEWRGRQVTANYKSSGGTAGDLVSLEMR